MEKKRFEELAKEHNGLVAECEDVIERMMNHLIKVLRETGRVEVREGDLQMYLSYDTEEEKVQAIRASEYDDDVIVTVYGIDEDGVDISMMYDLSYQFLVPVANGIMDYLESLPEYGSGTELA